MHPGRDLVLGVAQWLTPWSKGRGRVLSETADGAAVVEVPVGKGKLVLCGAYLGEAYLARWTADFETFVDGLVRGAGWRPEIEVASPRPDKDTFVYIKSGKSGGRRMVFVFFPAGCDETQLSFRKGFFARGRVRDIVTGKRFALAGGGSLALPASPWRFSVLVEE
jgi:hypothetical protein